MRKLWTPFNALLLLFIASFSAAMAMETSNKKGELIADFERASLYTAEYMEAMPAEDFGFKPTEDVRSFAQQFLHIAGANYFFASMIAGVENPKDGIEFEKLDEYQSKEACMKAVKESYDFIIETLKGLSEEELAEQIKLFNQFDMTKGVAFSKAFEHGVHHRGQTTIYIRLKGITPLSERLF
ncbi:DinB family protein [Jiulongibacter sp. NS-SX5]|uniref:DinB family protein n=1 Tax=Jiulongibacter sp. NS-SX5 TaxID=3463854 RepID=UPI0040594E77